MNNDEAVRLRRVVTRLARTFNGLATDEDLTPSQASVLGMLAARGSMSVAEIAKRDNLNPSMTSRVVGALEDKGLVERRPDPNDLRAVTVTITRPGRTVQARVKAKRAQAIQHAAQRLTSEQHAALLAALPALEALAPSQQ